MSTEKKVLICEDNEVELKAIKIAVERFNAQAYLANDGKKAIRLIHENPGFDLIITDIHMPFHNGDEILDLIRNHYRLSTPVIMISSDRAEEVVKLAMKMGVDTFIEKPIDPAVVGAALKKFL
jgi:DNA-binding response OmpR family regulator